MYIQHMYVFMYVSIYRFVTADGAKFRQQKWKDFE